MAKRVDACNVFVKKQNEHKYEGTKEVVGKFWRVLW